MLKPLPANILSYLGRKGFGVSLQDFLSGSLHEVTTFISVEAVFAAAFISAAASVCKAFAVELKALGLSASTLLASTLLLLPDRSF